MSWSLVQRNPTGCPCLIVCDLEMSKRGGLGPIMGIPPRKEEITESMVLLRWINSYCFNKTWACNLPINNACVGAVSVRRLLQLLCWLPHATYHTVCVCVCVCVHIATCYCFNDSFTINSTVHCSSYSADLCEVTVCRIERLCVFP